MRCVVELAPGTYLAPSQGCLRHPTTKDIQEARVYSQVGHAKNSVRQAHHRGRAGSTYKIIEVRLVRTNRPVPAAGEQLFRTVEVDW